jgi:hypothetical protein
MKNTISVFTPTGDELQCAQNWNSNTNSSNVEVSLVQPDLTIKYIGEIKGLSIPDVDDEEEDFQHFDNIVRNFYETI